MKIDLSLPGFENALARAAKCEATMDPLMSVIMGPDGGSAADGLSSATVAEGDRPRHVIRGQKSHTTVGQFGEVGIGWLRLSFKAEKFDNVFGTAISYWGGPKRKNGKWGYSDRWSWSNGVFLAFDDPTGHDRVSSWCTLEVQGSILESMTGEELLAFIRECKALEARGTRVDCSYDDFNWIITPEQVHTAAEAGKCVGFRTGKFLASGTFGGAKGCTQEFGRRGNKGSGMFVRCYDKKAESGGAIDCVRWECETANKKAQAAFERLAVAESVEDLGRIVGEIVGGSIDWRDRSSGDPNLSRLPRLDWWLRILEQIGRAPIRVAYPVATMPKKTEWVKRSVSKTLVQIKMYCEALTLSYDRFMCDVMMQGRAAMKESDLAVVKRGVERAGWLEIVPTRSRDEKPITL